MLYGVAVAAVWGSWSARALAICSLSPPAIAFSYPDRSIDNVPPDAVFWAVGTGDVVTVTLDGMALVPLGAGVPERHQFAPDEPLSLGRHELSIAVAIPAGSTTERYPVATETLSFNVTEDPAFDTRGEIVAVTSYSFPPPDEAFEGDCSVEAVGLLPIGCNDTTPPSRTRLALSTEPGALAYVVDNYIVPADCKVFFPYAYSEAAQSPLSIAAIGPTGLGPATPFAGTPQSVDYTPPPGTFREGPSGWCSIKFGAQSWEAAWVLTFLSSAALFFIRRRTLDS